MIIVKIVGGLGNQMFQYAYAKALQKKGHEIKIDLSAFETYHLHGGYQLNKYQIDLAQSTKNENNQFYNKKIATKILKRIGLINSKIIHEKNLLFDPALLNVESNNYISGYFQSENYFYSIRDTLLKQFILKTDITTYSKNLKKMIQQTTNSCSLHVRRGDFTNQTNINIHGTCSLEYYQTAITYLQSKLVNVHYFVFSDDIEWVKKNLIIDHAIYVDSEIRRLPHEDIYLMSLCENNIIANSSFSWWGAWLNKNEHKLVIAPKQWFSDAKLLQQSKDIVPKNWIKI